MTPLKTQAIQTALTGDWKTAISLNQELLKENPSDIETLNRLAFAFSVLGKAKSAKAIYQKVLELDIQNPIALKNLRRLSGTDKKNNNFSTQTPNLAQQTDTMFLEESGKTKVIELNNVAEPKIISHLMTGEFLTLRIKRSKIFVLDGKEKYIGMLPEDISRRLIKFIKGGNCYQACVKSIQNRHVSIFVRETKRCTRFKFQPSFTSGEKVKVISSKGYQPSKDHEDNQEESESEEES
ncbi:MAG: hypothetical protein HYT83_03565 [Candidatus Levybacteria bacterium]|nr:hypothetical protein [Candidatus Levybacteria bacterium]